MDPGYQAVLEAFGAFQAFEETVPGAPDLVLRGLVIDLRGVDGMTWMETLMEGRPMPPPLVPDEVEDALRVVLECWHDDARVEASGIATHLRARRRPADAPDVRRSVERARARDASSDVGDGLPRLARAWIAELSESATAPAAGR